MFIAQGRHAKTNGNAGCGERVQAIQDGGRQHKGCGVEARQARSHAICHTGHTIRLIYTNVSTAATSTRSMATITSATHATSMSADSVVTNTHLDVYMRLYTHVHGVCVCNYVCRG